jgi:hypothetical protein
VGGILVLGVGLEKQPQISTESVNNSSLVWITGLRADDPAE